MVLVTPVTNHDNVSEATQTPLRKSALTGPSWEATKPKLQCILQKKKVVGLIPDTGF